MHIESKKQIILTEVSNSKALLASAKKMFEGNDIYKDCLSEIILYLAEMPNDKLYDLYDSNKIIDYCCGIIYFSRHSANSPFYKKYIKQEPYIKIDTEPTSIGCEALLKQALDEIEKDLSKHRYPVEAKIYRLYLDKKNMKEVARITDIPYVTINGYIKKINKLIQKRIK